MLTTLIKVINWSGAFASFEVFPQYSYMMHKQTRFLSAFHPSQRGTCKLSPLLFVLQLSTHTSYTNTQREHFTEDLVLTNTPHTPRRPRLYSEEELPWQTKGCWDKYRTRWKLYCWHGNHPIICMARFDVWRVDGGFWVRERERGEENRFDPAAWVLFISADVVFLDCMIQNSDTHHKTAARCFLWCCWSSLYCRIAWSNSCVHVECICRFECMCVNVTQTYWSNRHIDTLHLNIEYEAFSGVHCQHVWGPLLTQLHWNTAENVLLFYSIF